MASLSSPLLLTQVKIWFQNRRMKWRNSKERELLATGMGSRDQTLPNKNNPNPDLSDAVCDRQSASPGSTSSSEAKASGAAVSSATGTLATTSPVRDESGVAHTNDSISGYGAESASQTAFLANIYNGGKLSSYPSMKSQTYEKAAADYDDTSDSSMNSDEEINVTW